MVLLAAALSWISTSPGIAAAEEEQLFDCVIEPHALIKLGSPTSGVVGTVLVDRSDRVKKNQVVATMMSSLPMASKWSGVMYLSHLHSHTIRAMTMATAE